LELRVALSAWPAGASKALLMVRPEKICVSKRPVAGAENCFQATIAEEIFQGAFDHLVLKTDVGATISAVVPNESAIIEALHEGDRVWCGLHFDDVVIVPME
jgi:spermidine/putrescine transport system ATP-binding protein